MSAFNPDLEIDDIVFRIYSHYDFEYFDGWEVDDHPYRIDAIRIQTDKYGTRKTLILRLSEKHKLWPNERVNYETSPTDVFKTIEAAQNECNWRNEIERQIGEAKANINDLFEVKAQCSNYNRLHEEYRAFGSQLADFPQGAYINRKTGKLLTRADWNKLKYPK